MQKLCNLLTNFALCYLPTTQRKCCLFKTQFKTLFTESEWTNSPMSDAVVTSPMRPGDSSGAWDGVTPPAVTTRHFCKQVVCVCVCRGGGGGGGGGCYSFSVLTLCFICFIRLKKNSGLSLLGACAVVSHRIFLIITFTFFQKGSERNIWNLCRISVWNPGALLSSRS